MNEETCKLDIKIRPLLCEVSGLHWTNTWYGENLVLSLCLNRITSYMQFDINFSCVDAVICWLD